MYAPTSAIGWWLVVGWMDFFDLLGLGAYSRSSKQLYAWTCSRRRRSRRRGGLIVNVMSKFQGVRKTRLVM